MLALGFRRGSGKGIVSITAGNAALSRRCPGRSRPQQHGAPEKEVGKCRAAAFMVFPLANSAFTSIEPKSQSGSTRTSFRASSSARALFSLDVAIPARRRALAVAPSLMVIARVEPPTPDGPQSNTADSGLWMIPLQNAGLLEIREITACLSDGSADGENR